MKLRSIDDPILSKVERDILRCALKKFAKHHHRRGDSMSLAEKVSGTIELYEHGFLAIEATDDGVIVRLSTPDEVLADHQQAE